MKKKIALFASTTLTGGLLLTGCGASPCADLQRASQEEIAAANQGAEIEREVDHWSGDVECELNQGRWVEEDD